MGLKAVTQTDTHHVRGVWYKTCKKCGFKMPNNVAVCWNCGTHLENQK